MKKSYKLVDLDCANCAQKMEDAIKKLDGVQDASVKMCIRDRNQSPSGETSTVFCWKRGRFTAAYRREKDHSAHGYTR